MADNEKTYKATVDVETKDAAKNVDLLNKTISTSLGEFENLNEAIGKTQDTLGKLDPNSEAFKELSKELQGLKDDLIDTEIQSSRFTEALAAQPGVMGLVGQSLEGLRGTMKVFMANPIIAVVTLIAGAFITLRESLTKTSEGQETLNRISAAFGKILGPVFAVIEKVALPLFEGFAAILEKVANGFNRFARFLGISEEKIEEASRNSSEVLQEEYEAEVDRQEEQTKTQEEESQKRIEQQKKEAEERARIQQEAEKILLESQLSLLSDRDRELQEREMRYQEELKALKKAGVTDLTAFEEEYRMDTAEINKKYDDEELKRLQEQEKKKQEERDKANEIALKNQEEYNQFIVDSEQFKNDALDFIQNQQIANIQGVGSLLGQIAGENKKLAIAGLVIEQGAAIAGVVVDTARSISAASAAAAPFIANPVTAVPATANLARVILQQKIAAGLSIAGIVAGAAQGISQINSADVPGTSGGSVPSAGSVNIPTPSIGSTTAPEFQTGGTVDTGTQVAGVIGRSQDAPIRAYVVSTEVSSQQALDRRTNVAATFN